MFRALNTVIITPWTLGAGMCKHTPSEDGQHTDQYHATQNEQGELDYPWVTLGYGTSQNHNIAELTQHRPAAHPVLALLSKAQTRPLYHHHLIPAGEGKTGRSPVSVSPPPASSVLASKVSEFTRAPQSSAAVGPGGQKRQAKQAKTGGVTVTWDSQRAEELVMKRCHTRHYSSLPKTLYSAVVPKQHQGNERFTSYCPPLIQNTPSFWEQLHRQLQSSFSWTRPVMFTKLCVLQDFLTSARLHPCRMWVFTATTELLTANTFWLKCEVHILLNSRPKWS